MRYAVRLPREFLPGAPVVVDLSGHRPSELTFELTDSSAGVVASCLMPPHAFLSEISAHGHELVASREQFVAGAWETDGGFGRLLVAVSTERPGNPAPLSRWHLRHIEERSMAGVVYRATAARGVAAECSFGVVDGSVQVDHRLTNEGGTTVRGVVATTLSLPPAARLATGTGVAWLEWVIGDSVDVRLEFPEVVAVCPATQDQRRVCFDFRYPKQGCVELVPGASAHVLYQLRVSYSARSHPRQAR